MSPKVEILIVDDESRICDSLSSILSCQGYAIHTASSGVEAEKMIHSKPFDIAVFDYMLPDTQGTQLIKKLKEQNPDAQAIVMTGNVSIDSAVSSLRNGAFDYLKKPFEPAQLLQTVKNACAQQQLLAANKKIRQKLSLSRRHYRYLVDNSPDIIYTLDHKGCFTFANHSMEHLLGLNSKDIVGQHYSKIVGRNNAEKCKWIINERRTGKRAKKWSELQLIKFDNRGRPSSHRLFAELQSTGMYKKDSGQKPLYIGTHGVIRDISDRKRIEIQKNRIQSRLRRTEKMEAMGMLASGVAHDLNNVLSSILGYPELILIDMEKDDPKRDYIIQIQKSGEKAAVIVKDLLTLARRGVDVSEAVNLDGIICDYFTSPEYLKLVADFPQIMFNINLSSKRQNILGSPVHLSKCLMNLLTNAAEAMPKGGLIRVSTQKVIIEKNDMQYQPLPAGKYIHLTIADSGTGIAQDDLKRIFDPFFTKKQMGKSGTGLGMTIVWTTVKDHNGHIDVKSIPGKGTTFHLYFPITEAEPENREDFNIDRLKGNGERILIVDDMPDQQSLAANMLKVLGYRTFCVSSGRKAIAHLNAHQTDLILLDMVLGNEFDGLDTYREIRQIYPAAKVILVSGLSQTRRIEKALELGVRQFIKKPYSIKTIGLAVFQELHPFDEK